jgi:transposase
MTDVKLLSRLLRMKGFRAVWYEVTDSLLRVGVKPHKTGCRCPECGRRCRIVNHLDYVRVWEDVVVCGRRVLLCYAPKEIRCPTHGRLQERIPWAEANARVTYRREYLVLRLCQQMSQKAVAEVLHTPQSTVSDILHRTIHRLRDGHRIDQIKTLGIDEISYRKGKKYATIVYDIDRQCVVWAGKGKGRETADQFFGQVLTEKHRAGIRFAASDMSKAYLGAIKQWCPAAVLVIDRFHVAKALNEAVDEVRKVEWREAKGDERKALKGIRWLLYRHCSTRSKADTRRLNELKKSNRRIHRAWVLKDEFQAFWEYTYPKPAESFFRGWIAAAMRSRLEPIKSFAQTLRNHAESILPFVATKLTNAVGEGINRIIKIVKNRASGYANLPAFIDMIYLTVGDMDLPAQIPPQFRTL